MEDYYCVEEFSDNEVIDSSDDEDFKSLFTCIDSEEEDFEAEMERERQSHINGIHKSDPSKQSSIENKTNGEECDSEAKNDELLYDPKSDENDQKWVDNQRPKSSNNNRIESTSTSNRVLTSDATLNCSACMALLCMDCQRHEIYRTQYRAMFVFNCRIDFTEKLQFKQKQKKRKRDPTSDDYNRVDNYFAVFCEECNTQVAVYDNDQVYHFFGVLASF